MKIFLLILVLFTSSCQWLTERAINNWTSDTVELLLEMSLRKSMINDTPLKTMERLEAPSGVELSKKKLCGCAVDLYGGIMTVIANDLKESSIKNLCTGMGKCFFKSKAPEFFKSSCYSYIEKSKFKKLARDRRKSLLRFTKARRKLSASCSSL